MATLALAQTTSGDDFQKNLDIALDMVGDAADLGVDLLMFPEVFLFVGGRQGKLAIAQPVDGPVVSRFRDLAQKHGLLLLLGSVHERIPGDPRHVYNTSILLGRDGELLATYRKLKLFDVELPDLRIKESDTIVPGDSAPPVVATDIGRIGLTICFDLRYPDLYQDLRGRGADLICVPSNFTVPTGCAHWEILLRTRAIENQVYIAAPAQVGQHNPKYASYGHTLLVDPWGGLVCERKTDTGLVTGELDLSYLEQVRARLPMGVRQR